MNISINWKIFHTLDLRNLSFPPPIPVSTGTVEGRLQRESSNCLKKLDTRLREYDDPGFFA